MSNIEFYEKQRVASNSILSPKNNQKESFLSKLLLNLGVSKNYIGRVMIITAAFSIILMVIILELTFFGSQRLTDAQLIQYNKSHAIPRPNSQ